MRLVVLLLGVLMAGLAAAQTPGPSAVGPAIGTRAPSFSAVDQMGRSRTLESLIEREGLMLVFFRSADW